MQHAASNPADTLLQRLKTLFSGNFLHGDEIVEADRKIQQHGVELRITWYFKIFHDTKEYKGNPGVKSYRHFGRDIEHYQNTLAQKNADGLNNIAYRTKFLNDLTTLGTEGLKHAEDDRFEVHHLGWFSVHTACSPCNETGQVKCGGCNGGGSVRCRHCHGTGTEYVYQSVPYTDSRGQTQYRNEQVGRMCFNCRFGRVSCGNCSGDGKVDCKNCATSGFLTRVTQLALHAIPEPKLVTQGAENSGLLVEYLQTVRCRDFPRRLSYQNACLAKTDDTLSSGTVIYSFQATITQLSLEIKQQSFTFHALGRKDLTLISRPHVFDFLFENIFIEWNEITGGSGQKVLDFAKAKNLFDKLRTATVPSQILEMLCQEIKLGELAHKIRDDVCYNLISDTTASGLIVIEQRILSVLSPRYSENWWYAAMILPWLALFLLGHTIGFDTEGLELVIIPAILLVIGLLLTLIAGVIVHPISAISSRRIQKTLPSQFRRSAAFKEPLFRYVKLTMGVCLLSVVTGVIFHYFDIDALYIQTGELVAKLGI